MDLTQNKEKIKEFQERAKELVAQMTLEEKVSQMVHGAAAVDRLGIKAYNWWNEARQTFDRMEQKTPSELALRGRFLSTWTSLHF